MEIKIALVDNYDSFTYNLAHAFRELGCEVSVMRNDKFALPELSCYDAIVLSPGPGIPSEAGLLIEVIKSYSKTKPILGICLGHQAIGEVFGAELYQLKKVYHGVATPCKRLCPDAIFEQLDDTFSVGRYHSWALKVENLPHCLIPLAISDDGCLMAMRHSDFPIYGIQFHPESVLTPVGEQILKNWVKMIENVS